MFKKRPILNEEGCNMESGKVAALIRYPVKGLEGQQLNEVTLEPGKCMPLDRAFAIENGPIGFDEKDPKHFAKVNFLTLMRHERLALLQTDYDDETGILTILRQGRQVARGDLGTKIGRNMIEQFIAAFMSEELKGPPRILSASEHHFTDMAEPALHIINLASVTALELIANMPLDPARFRANIHLEGLEPWVERGWQGKRLKIGDVEIEVLGETDRCAAVNVDLTTAKRGRSLPATLAQHFGTNTFGVYAKVLKGGTVNTRQGCSLIE